MEDKIVDLLSQWKALVVNTPDVDGIVMDRLRLDWNYHSNSLEGNTLSYGETRALLMYGVTAGSKPLRDHIEMSGHNEALLMILDFIKEERPLTENFIREIHQLILKEPYEVDAITNDGRPSKKRVEIGSYKALPNHVRTQGGEIFRFASPEETPAMMSDLLTWYHRKTDQKDCDPILLCAEFHYKFIRIHPFDDGNGRTARILMNFILMKNDYPPVIIKVEDKRNYISALQKADLGLFRPFLDYITSNLIYSLQRMITLAKNKGVDTDSKTYLNISKDFIKNDIMAEMLDTSYSHRNLKSIKKKLKITDNDIAEWLQYKNDKAYRQSSAKGRIEHFIVEFYNRIVSTI